MAATCRITCHGYLEEADLSTVDLEGLAGKVLSEEIGRPELFMEIRDAGILLGTVHTGPLYPTDSDTTPDRWCLTFAEPNEDGRWCLSDGKAAGRYDWYVFCGAETEILGSCAVRLSAVLQAIRDCCRQKGRAHSVPWIAMEQAMNL